MLLESFAQGRELVLALLPLPATLQVGTNRSLAFEIGELAADARVLTEIPEVALHRLFVAVQRLLLRPHLAGKVDDGAIGLELRK